MAWIESNTVLLMISKMDKQKKRIIREERIFQILLLIFTLSFIGFLIISNLRINQRRNQLIKEIESLQQEVQILEEEKTNLEAGISETQSESYWEEKIREQGYVREGENPVVVLPSQEEGIQEEKNIWNPKNWLDWIKSKLRD